MALLSYTATAVVVELAVVEVAEPVVELVELGYVELVVEVAVVVVVVVHSNVAVVDWE